VVWCSTDEESRLLCKLIPDAIEVKGSHTPEQKEERLTAFSTGEARIIVTKPKIAGMGLNWQHCADMVYCSPTFSFQVFLPGITADLSLSPAAAGHVPRGDRRDRRERDRGGRSQAAAAPPAARPGPGRDAPPAGAGERLARG
jgi:hypothetical protein